jgi:hypothetical protein
MTSGDRAALNVLIGRKERLEACKSMRLKVA